ncbi:MAG: hypothetical protein ACLFUG_01040 [Nitriliruptoraceae bacterium]
MDRTDLDIDHLAARYRAGTSLRTLAADAGVPPLRLAELLGHAGVTRRQPTHTRQRLDVDVDLAVSRYEAGVAVRAIAEELGVSASTIRRRLIAAGVWRGRR